MSGPARQLLAVAALAVMLALAASASRAACTAGPPLPGVAEQTPDTEFVNRADGTAVHVRTRLVWKRCAEGQAWDGATCTGTATAYDWDQAKALGGAAFAGSSQWRLPNRKELESLAEFCGHSPAINQTAFPATPAERFWTATNYQEEPATRAWDLYFADGYAGTSNKAAAYHVRLVRSLAAADLPLAQTITFGAAPALSLGQSAAVTVAASSGLAVSLSTATPSTCTVTGATVSAIGTGACRINANQSGNATFAAAPTASLDIAIGVAAQTISFGAVPVLTVGGNGTVSATASSGLAVTLGNLTPASCSLSGSTVSGVSVGTCSSSANQAGNSSYAAAPQVTQSIPVSAAAGGGDPPTPPPAQVTITLLAGWNLIGNGSDTAFTIDEVFGQNDQVSSIWKWVFKGRVPGIKYPAWAFRSSSLPDKGQAYAGSQGYELLNTVNPGEAFWVQAKSAFSVTLPGTPLPASAFTPAGVPAMPGGGSLALDRGWSLIATGEDLSPEQFHAAIGGSASKLVSLWAWDAGTGKWLFYAPELQQRGGAALRDYANRRGYRDFLQNGKRLLPGTGFWVHRQ